MKDYPANKHYTRDELRKIAKERGWEISETRGKGSHWWASRPGERGSPIPSKITKGVEEAIKKRLGLKSPPARGVN